MFHNGAMTDPRPPHAPAAPRTPRTRGRTTLPPACPEADAPAAAAAPRPARRPSTASRRQKEHGILREAEAQFAQFGFEGASLENIAAAIGLTRHNLLYYFPSKEALYQRVLDDVMTEWLDGMEALTHSDAPHDALRRYIRAKMRYTRERPLGAKVFTKEVMAGAPRYGKAIVERVGPVLRKEVRTFERWAREGHIARVDFTHLMFILWSVTQAYAEQEAQFALLLGKPALTDRDFDKAEELIAHMVLRALAP